MYNISVKIKRLGLIVMILLIFLMCFGYMNQSFDRLSRYPYQNENDRQLIDRYLNDSEIEYLIEYSIAPVYFIKYISSPGFNIYHIEEYQKIEDNYWYLSYDEIVSFTESLLNYENGISLGTELASDYYYQEILDWLENGDEFNPESEIITNPEYEGAYLDDTHTMTKRIPYDLILLELGTFGEEFYLKNTAAQAFENMCQALALEYRGESGGLIVESAYIPYEQQVELFYQAKNTYLLDYLNYVDYPGHSEHQLGLAFDFSFYGYDSVIDAPQYNWILENAHTYGFIQSYTEKTRIETGKAPRLNHLRYVGVELATKMHNENKSLKEVVS